MQKKYGGTAEDKNDNYWPPSYPCNDFGEDKTRYESENVRQSTFIQRVNDVPSSLYKGNVDG